MKKSKILYVDDEFINLQLFKINFRNKYEVVISENAKKGLEALDNDRDIQVVISDIKMPNMCSIEFIEKAKEKYPDKKYYILSGFEITEEIQDALDSKLILKYFRKPLDIVDINKTIQEVIV